MTLTAALASFAVVAALMTITPGLDTALVLRTAAARGATHAWCTALGVGLGVLVWAGAAAAGVSALLAASEVAFTVVRLAGAAYMVYLGVGMLVRALRGTRVVAAVEVGQVTRLVSFREGLLTNLLNPKVGAFYVAVLPQFLPPGESALLVGLLLGLVHTLLGVLWFGLLIAAAASVGRFLARPGVVRGIDGVAGAVITGFGVRLALAR